MEIQKGGSFKSFKTKSMNLFKKQASEEQKAKWRAYTYKWRATHPKEYKAYKIKLADIFRVKYANDPKFKEHRTKMNKKWRGHNKEAVNAAQKRRMAMIYECWQMYRGRYLARKEKEKNGQANS